MRKITPVTAFSNGALVALTTMTINHALDNLVTTATFDFTLASDDGSVSGAGQFVLTGDAYPLWDGSIDSTYALVAQGVGLTLA